MNETIKPTKLHVKQVPTILEGIKFQFATLHEKK